MTRQQLIDFTTKSLTGGGMITLDLTPDIIDETLSNTLDILKPWYLETVVIEQVSVNFTSNPAQNDPRSMNGYFSKSSLSRPVNFIDTILPLRSNYKGDYVLDEISDLVGLPAGLFSSDATREYAVWISTRNMIRKSLSLKMLWKEIGDDVYIYKVPTESAPYLSVFYYPTPVDVSEITYGPALNWLKKRYEAELKKIWSLILLKASTAPYLRDFANTLRTEALTDIKDSNEELKTIQFKYINFQRT